MIPSRAQELAVLRSVIYASLFDYPLTLPQLHATLVGVRAGADTIMSWWRASDLLQATIEFRDGLFFPAGRADLIATRRRRESLSRELLKRDGCMLALVCRMPFVRAVALSGSLAHLNAEDNADLDLFVISRLRGWRKRLCLNYVISESAMQIDSADLFSANQIIHLRPIVGERVLERFVTINRFVRDFYPNFEMESGRRPPFDSAQGDRASGSRSGFSLLVPRKSPNDSHARCPPGISAASPRAGNRAIKSGSKPIA